MHLELFQRDPNRNRREKRFGRIEKLKNGNEVEQTLKQHEKKKLL
jgi:hypothetical protein